MIHRDAKYSDLTSIKELLQFCSLPSNDCNEHWQNFILVKKNGNIIGTGGFESYGEMGLLRSVAVIPDERGKGIGKKIVRLLEEKALHSGVNVLFLLTESAEKYFSNFGFVVKPRDEAPASIRETKQFKGLCPASEIMMFRKL